MKDKKKIIGFIVVYALMILIIPRINIFANLIIQYLSGDLYLLGSYIIIAILALILFKNDLKEEFKEFKNKPLKVLGTGILGVLVIVALNIILALVFKKPNVTTNQKAVEAVLKTSVIAPIVIAIVGPFVEEIMFRFILIGKFKEKISKSILAIISIISFAFIHLHRFQVSEILDLRGYVVIGAAITIFYIKNNCRLAYALVIHITNNLISVLISSTM